MQIIVLGMHRSHTSLVTGLIHLMGAHVGAAGRCLPPSADNRKGYFERWDVMAINEALLRSRGCAWNDVSQWPLHEEASASAAEWDRMRGLLAALDRHRPWVMKDPRLCLTYRHWAPLLPAAVPIVVYRDPRQVARSLSVRDGMTTETALALWEFYAVSLLQTLAGAPRIVVRSEDALRHPLDAVRTLREQLSGQRVAGLRMPAEADVLTFLDRSLDHSADARELAPLCEHQARVASALQEDRGAATVPAVSAAAMAILAATSRPHDRAPA
jgi:hypothetical protein